MNWASFQSAAPDLAAEAEALFERTGVLLLGTLRQDGSPRISPVEPLFAGGELYLGMMPRTLKVRDLLRDPRCTVHNALSDRMAAEGECKLHGRARHVLDAAERKLYCDGLKAKIGWSPEGMEFQLFAIEVESAGLFRMDGEARRVRLWRAGEPIESFKQDVLGDRTPLD
jgi:hypothetical protein